MQDLQRTTKLAEGKTKTVWATNNPGLDVIESRDDITAGDGKKHDVIPAKGIWSNSTTCNIFRLLNQCGIPTAFKEQIDDRSFAAVKGHMIPLEVVVRREAWGSYLKRNPNLTQGHLFPKLVFELYLKTSGRKWQGEDILCDDPMIDFRGTGAQLFDPALPVWVRKPFMEISMEKFYKSVANAPEIVKIEEYARRVFLILEKAWQLQGHRLLDFKLEFMLSDEKEEVLLADVIDSDSWRKKNLAGEETSKQIYRDGGKLDTVAEKFLEAARLSERFVIPNQQVIIWTGSPKDDTGVFHNEMVPFHKWAKLAMVTCSAHKEPVRAYAELHRAIQNAPDAVVIAYIGLSNGAGPTLSANCTVPVITIPATGDKFPVDVWSSLRTPSSVPVLTVLKPENAFLAALQILAMRNPALYAALRYKQEERLTNFATIG